MKVLRLTNQDERFYKVLGPYLSRRSIVSELGSPVWDDDGKEWFVAFLGGSVVGFSARKTVDGHTAFLSAYVLPEYRNRGVYTALVEARLEGITGVIKSVVQRGATPALRKVGFVAVGTRGKFTVMERR